MLIVGMIIVAASLCLTVLESLLDRTDPLKSAIVTREERRKARPGMIRARSFQALTTTAVGLASATTTYYAASESALVAILLGLGAEVLTTLGYVVRHNRRRPPTAEAE